MPHIDANQLESDKGEVLLKEIQAQYLTMTHSLNPDYFNKLTISAQVLKAELDSVSNQEQLQSLDDYCDSYIEF